MQQMNQRVILRHGVGQLGHVRQKKRKDAAGSARLRLIRIRIREAAVKIEREPAYPFGPPQRRRRAEAIETVAARPLLEHRSELAEVVFAAEQTAVVRQSMGAEFEPALTEPF